LIWGSSIFAKVLATNVKGNSLLSDAGNGAVILRVPDAPVGLANLPAITNAVSVGLSWSDGTWNGGSAIIDYRISYAVGAGEFTVLETSVTSNPYTAIALTTGTTYKFKVQARNGVGYSAFSNEVTVLTA
jgi:hypothetical protein